MTENMHNSHSCYEKKIVYFIILQQSPTYMESMRCLETLVGKTRGKGGKVQHMVNEEKVNQELDMKTTCHTEHNEAQKIFIVSSGKDIIALSSGNLIFNIEGNNFAWALLIALSYYYVFDQSFCAAYCKILYLMQHFILGDMTESKEKFHQMPTVLMWMNTLKFNAKYSKGFIPIRQSLEHELQDGTSTSTNRTELHVSNDGASTGTSMITGCTANSSSSTIGYSDGESCLIDLDFGDGNTNTEKGKGKGKSSNSVLIREELLGLNFTSDNILSQNVVSTPSSVRIMASISPMENGKSDTFNA